MELKLSNTINLEVNGRAVEEKTQEIFISKNRKGKIKKRVRTLTTYSCPKRKWGKRRLPILDWQERIHYYREKIKTNLFKDLINKK